MSFLVYSKVDPPLDTDLPLYMGSKKPTSLGIYLPGFPAGISACKGAYTTGSAGSSGSAGSTGSAGSGVFG